MRLKSPGFAWAARRDLIEKFRFYDSGVIGAGDMALIHVAIGNIEQEISIRMPASSHANHYRRWALPFHDAVRGRIGFTPGVVTHLWHGDFRDRQYRVRFRKFRQFDFNPLRDIARDEQDCWRWASDKPLLHDFVKNFFTLRCEDGDYEDLRSFA